MRHKHIEIFSEYLKLLAQLLKKIKLSCGEDELILHERLAKDMFPLVVQVEIAASFALRSCCPIAGVDVKSFNKPEKSFDALAVQLNETIEYIESLDTRKNNLGVVVRDKAGPIPVALKAEEFLLRFAYPNFYFHLSMVYAIARAHGLALTKGDFDGVHDYPPGFSFE